VDTSEVAARLDASAGRGPQPDGTRPHQRRGRPSRARPLAAGLLVAALAAGWLIVQQRSSTNAAPSVAVSPPRPTTPPAPRVDTSALRGLLADAGACADVIESVPSVRCEIDGVRLDARLLGTADAKRTYVASSGARLAPRHGPPACAQGRPEERSWSRPETPEVVAGRYHCRREDGAAAMWWTDEHGVIAHAVAADDDLARLFAWWTAHRDG
jgi:hypothetical protein